MKINLTKEKTIVLLFLTVLILGSCTAEKKGDVATNSGSTNESTEYLKNSGTLKAIGGEAEELGEKSVETEIVLTGSTDGSL